MGQSIEKAIAAACAVRCCGNCEHWQLLKPRSDRLGRCNFPMPASVDSVDLMLEAGGDDCEQFELRKGR